MFNIVKKRGLPIPGEVVVAKIVKINPNSVFAKLDEYENIEGMIHISEVSSGWIKDIRNFVKMNETVIAKVMKAEDEHHISLSLKRVDQKQINNKTKEHRLNQRAEKMLELAAKKLGTTLDIAYEEVGYLIQEVFGSLYEGFLISIEKPENLKKRGIPEKWITVIKEIAEKNIEQKEFEFKAALTLRTIKPDGVNIIKKSLLVLAKDGLDVRYIAAPEYLVKFKTNNAKKGEKKFIETLDNFVSSVKKDAEASYKIM